jgi:hypothetical protein
MFHYQTLKIKLNIMATKGDYSLAVPIILFLALAGIVAYSMYKGTHHAPSE